MGPHGHPVYDGQGHLPAGHVAHLRRLVHHGVQGHADEIVVHQLYHRTDPPHGHAYGHAAETRLADGRIPDPHLSELLQQSPGDGEGRTHDAHILTQDHHILVTQHLLPQTGKDRLTHRQVAHQNTLLSLSSL